MRRNGFTLIELLVVVGIIGVLAGLIFPVIGTARAEARSMQCLNNLRQIWTAVDTWRTQNREMLPYCEALPAPTPNGPVGGLPAALERIVPRESPMWLSPADFSPDSEDLGTSYIYVAGAFMLLQPPNPNMSGKQNEDRATRIVTRLYENGYLRTMPLVTDSEPRHVYGSRLPRNVLMFGGEVRPQSPDDGVIPGSE